MYKETLETICDLALEKIKMLQQHAFRYLLSSGLAGAYVGFGIVLIFTLGGQLAAVKSPYTSFIMGISFAVALILVIFSGAELFTGNHMIYTINTLSKKAKMKDAVINWVWCYAGNALGAVKQPSIWRLLFLVDNKHMHRINYCKASINFCKRYIKNLVNFFPRKAKNSFENLS